MDQQRASLEKHKATNIWFQCIIIDCTSLKVHVLEVDPLRVATLTISIHLRVATLIISILSYVCPHTYLSLRVCSYTNSKILQRDIYEKFEKHPYFLNIL